MVQTEICQKQQNSIHNYMGKGLWVYGFVDFEKKVGKLKMGI